MKKLLLLITIASLIVFACKKEPKVESSNFSITNEEIVKGTTSVVITVTYSYPSALERVDGYISVNNDMSNANKIHATIDQNTFVLRFNDLQANTQYYYQYEYSTGVDTYKTDISSFATNDYTVPMVSTADITNITALSAQCGGDVIDDGGLEITARGICWSNNTNPTIDDCHTSNGTGSGSFTSNITELTISTKYYVRAYAINSKGTSYGNTREFTTTDGKPTVITNEVTNITGTSAKCGGNVTSDGGFPVTERGVCWSISQNPTINDSHTNDGIGTGFFTSNIINLNGSTTYYLRAYATNSQGTSYGDQKTYQTLYAPPVGSINGVFSISASQQVYFSKGNLQYQASTNTWRFAENQYDYAGSNNANISSSYNGWIDLFGWATSGWDCGNQFFYPYNYESESAAGFGRSYGPPCECNLTGDYKYSDWGVFNRISNGGNETEMWQTLSLGEWYYLLNNRYNAAQKKSQGTVNEVHGLILLPDEWILPSGCSFYSQSNNWTTNNYTTETWSLMESAGAVFLPAAGVRDNKSVMFVNNSGHYWTTDYSYSTNQGGDLGFDDESIYTHSYMRYYGLSVRLVHFK